MAYQINEQLVHWLNEHALDLDQSNQHADALLAQLSKAQLFGLGVPSASGGIPNTTLHDAAWAIAEVAKHSLSAAFVLWAQRSFISYLVLHPNAPLSASLMTQALQGEIAGATGLSNAIKFIGGVEGLQVKATADGADWIIDGYLPWVSNLAADSFHVMVAVERPNLPPAVLVLNHADVGLVRNDDLALHCIQGSNTASIKITQCRVPANRIMAEDAAEFIRVVRPQFLALQSALSTGVALRCLSQVSAHQRISATVREQVQQQQARIIAIQNELCTGAEDGTFLNAPAALFALRIELAKLCQDASLLELQTEGGACFLQGLRDQTQRRVREALFLPMVSPSISQLQLA